MLNDKIVSDAYEAMKLNDKMLAVYVNDAWKSEKATGNIYKDQMMMPLIARCHEGVK
jgi:hypothetical protein